jgi:hypothetical protein
MVALLVRGSLARHSGCLPAQPRHALPQFEAEAQDEMVVDLVLADMFDYIRKEGRKWRLTGQKAGVSTPRF